jgi:hypothetical protein
VYSDLDFIDGTGKKILNSFFSYRHIPFFQNEIIPKDTFISLPAGPIASWSTSMVRRKMIEQFPIKTLWEDIRYSASDYDWYFQIATIYPVYGIQKSLTQYRRHSNNLSGSNGGTSFDLEKLIDIYYQRGYFSETVYRKKKSWLSITFSIFALEHGKKQEAFRYWKNSIHSSPFYGMIYKMGIFCFLLLPKNIAAKIIKSLIRRGE